MSTLTGARKKLAPISSISISHPEDSISSVDESQSMLIDRIDSDKLSQQLSAHKESPIEPKEEEQPQNKKES